MDEYDICIETRCILYVGNSDMGILALRILSYHQCSFFLICILGARIMKEGSKFLERYDRQIRLWGYQSQRTLKASHIVVLGATVSAVEAVKCLLLSGVGHVTLVDERKVIDDSDLAQHYFLPMNIYKESMGNDRAHAFSSVSFPSQSSPSKPCTFLAEALIRGPLGKLNPSSRLEAVVQRGDNWCKEYLTSLQFEDAMTLNPPSLLLSSHVSHTTGSCDAFRIAEVLRISIVSLEAVGLVGGWVITQLPSPYPYLAGYGQVPEPTMQNHLVEDLRPFAPFGALKHWMTATLASLGAPHSATMVNEWGSPLDHQPERTSTQHVPFILLLFVAYQRWCYRHPEQVSNAPSGSVRRLSVSELEGVLSELKALNSPILKEKEPEEACSVEHDSSLQSKHRSFAWVSEQSIREAQLHCCAKLNRACAFPENEWPSGLKDVLCHVLSLNPSYLLCKTIPFVQNSSKKLFSSSEALGLDNTWLLYSKCRSDTSRDPPAEWKTLTACEDFSSLLLHPHQQQMLSWYVVFGIRSFYFKAEEGSSSPSYAFPFNGYVPDIHTTTKWYKELRSIYGAKHGEDVQRVFQYAWEKLEEDLNVVLGSLSEPNQESKSKCSEMIFLKRRVCDNPSYYYYYGSSNAQGVRQKEGLNSRCQLQQEVQLLAKTMVESLWSLQLVSLPSALSENALCVAQTEEKKEGFLWWNLWEKHLVSQALSFLSPRKEIAEPPFGLAASRAEFPAEKGPLGCSMITIDACFALIMWVIKKRRCRNAIGEGAGKEEERLIWGPSWQSLYKVVKRYAQKVKYAPVNPMDGYSSGAQPQSVERTLAQCRPLKACVREVWRQRGVEVPCVASAIGALASDEVIKVLQPFRRPACVPLFYSGYSNTVRSWKPEQNN